MNPIFERLSELQDKVGRKLIIVTHAGGDSINNTPEGVADVARQFPQLLFLAAHSGYKWATPTVAHTIGPLANVLLDLTTMAGNQNMYECYRLFGPEKFTAGSDGPFATVNVKNAIVKGIAANRQEEALILGGNLVKHLGIATRR